MKYACSENVFFPFHLTLVIFHMTKLLQFYYIVGMIENGVFCHIYHDSKNVKALEHSWPPTTK